KGSGGGDEGGVEDGVHTVVRVREPRRSDEVQGVSGSTRLEAKRQRRRDGREQRRTRPPILSESEFLARREAVDRVMVVRQKPDRTQIAVLEDGVLVEHYVSRSTSGTMVGNVYLGKVQNVLPSMEAAFVDVGRGRNAVLYAGEVNWDATGLEGRARSIEQALRSGDSVLVQVTKDPIGHKGARLSSHIALSGRHLVYVPNGNASGISRKLPDTERKRLRDVLKKMVPDGAGVIVRTAAEGASEDELARDVKRLQAQWEDIQARAAGGHAPVALSEEPDLVIRVVRDLFNEDFNELVVQGDQAYGEIENYLNSVSPDLVERLHRHTGGADVFADKRIDEQILKGLDRKVFLPSGGHLVIDRTEAMTVVDVNTGKYTGAGGNLEETVTRNNLEAAEEIVRQLRLRDLGGIVVIDFIDMVLESNRELVLRRLTECLGRDRTKHQVTEITSLGLVQMTRKRIGAGLLEAFSETCDHCKGRGLVIHTEPVPEKRSSGAVNQVKAVAAATTKEAPARSRRRRGSEPAVDVVEEAPAVEEIAATEAEQTQPAEPVEMVADVPPPVQGSGIVSVTPALTTADSDDDYDMSGYDLSRYESNGSGPLAGADDPDAGEDEEAAGRRRSRRGGARRRTRP
ncbi:Rne/Rng family ribonuclease, partial [Actinoplanes sp. NPDC051633]|uniref:Rne/Rng family ribonuclease n=1 Tax=Actinoplanes sp. NPDC051633 TaxID=3155670 RepID=UPI003436145E